MARLCAESKLLLGLGLAFGLLAVFLVPPAITYDGPSHYFRALQVSEGTLRATVYSDRAAGGSLPTAHCAYVNSLWSDYWVRHDFGSPSSWAARSEAAAADRGRSPAEFTNTAVYSPVNYLFPAAGMRLAAALARSPLLASRLGCLGNLLGYLVLVVLALEKLPRYRPGLLLVSSCPVLVVQAASLSTDGINHALPVLLLAWAWNLRQQAPPRPGADRVIVIALSLLIALLKPTALAALPCLLWIPAGVFGSRRAKILTLAATFLGVGVLWFWWNRPNLGIDIARWFDTSRPPSAALRSWFVADPRRFVPPFVHLLRYDLLRQWSHLYGDVGGWVPRRAYAVLDVLSYFLLAGLVLVPDWEGETDWSWAGGMLIQAAGTLVLLALTLWLAFGTREIAWVPGLVGRYLTVVVVGLGIAWAEVCHRGLPRLRKALFWLALTGNAAGLAVILSAIGFRGA